MFTLGEIGGLTFLLGFLLAVGSCSEICLKHDSPFGVQYFRCEHGCCGTTYDRHCCIDSQTLTVVLSLLGSGIALAVIVAVIWAMKTAHKRSKVAPEVAAVMTQTDTGVSS